jgi:NADP-dependent 3-hydroxy acid dehydrogenase YdfG
VKSNIKSAVFITGTSSGIGKSIALYLDKSGYKVFAGVRKIADGEELKKLSSENLQPIIVDVTNQSDIIAAKELIESVIHNYLSFSLVNNAGVAIGSPIEPLQGSQLRLEMEVNYFGTIAVIQTFLPVLRQKKGKIINISSISGKISMPFNGTYCASKFAIEAITDALRIELKPSNISVSNILPGDINTEIWEKATNDIDKYANQWNNETIKLYGYSINLMKHFISNIKGSNPLEIAISVEKLLKSKKPKSRVYIGKNVWLYYFLSILPTSLRDWIIASIIKIPK